MKTVQVYLTRLRATLAAAHPDGNLVQTVGRSYRLALPAGAVDAYAFVDLVRRARRALEDGAPQQAERLLDEAFGLWRGKPYAEFADGAAFAAEAHRRHRRPKAPEEAAMTTVAPPRSSTGTTRHRGHPWVLPAVGIALLVAGLTIGLLLAFSGGGTARPSER